MSTTVHWRANKVTGKIVQRRESHDGVVLVAVPPTADPIQDAVNNVRFNISCISHHGLARCRIRSFQRFQFRPRTTGRLTANICAAPQGSVLFVAGPRDFRDCIYAISAGMRVTVKDTLGNVIFDELPDLEDIDSEIMAGWGHGTSETQVRVLDVAPFSWVLSMNTGVMVGPGYRVTITGMFEAFLSALGEFVSELDYSFSDPHNPPGDGLNFPFASITII